MKTKDKSRFLSLVLRHKPEVIGIKIDKEGWVLVSDLLSLCKEKKDIDISMEELEGIVSNDDKKRFLFNYNHKMIRANQGHSIKSVDVKLEDVTDSAPAILYHGTSEKSVDSIMEKGILKMKRNHCHLSKTVDVAKKVGSRHGKPVILEILVRKLTDDGHKVYKSENGVYLMDYIPIGYFRKV